MPITPHPRNVAGEFYVEQDCCTLCGVPWHIAPDLFDYNDSGCWVRRQPVSPAERDTMVQVIAVQELGCIRYRGGDPLLLRALDAVGERRQVDDPNALDERGQADDSSAADERPVYEIDGSSCASLEEFFEEVSRVLVPGIGWGRNLDAFNDLLRGGFGTPVGGFEIRWKNHQLSRAGLGYGETARHWLSLLRSGPVRRWPVMLGRALAACVHLGPTVFDRIEGIIREHGIGGSEASDGVRLLLE